MKKAAAPRRPPDPALRFRAVKWARLPGHGHTIAGACKRFGITASAYRKARRAFGEATRSYADEDLVLAAMHSGGPVRLEAIVSYYGWINRGELTRGRLLAILRSLSARGMVRRVSRGVYELIVEWP